jgi:hypothetical protein
MQCHPGHRTISRQDWRRAHYRHRIDLAVANKLNAMGNKHTAKARELSWQERKARQTQKLVDHRTDYNALPTITY